MNEANKSTTIQVRVSDEQKSLIGEKATANGMNISNYLRTIALSDQKTITLKEGTSIARLLVEVHKTLNSACANKVLSDEYTSILLTKIEKIWVLFDEISEKLTDIHSIADDEEEEL